MQLVVSQALQAPLFVFLPDLQCVKSVGIWSFSGPHFPAFGLNTDQKNSEYGHFSSSALIIVICLSNALPRGGYVNLAFSITLLWSEGSISSPVRYSFSSILPDDRDDVFAVSLLILSFYHQLS